MPYTIKKQDCKASDGSSGSWTLSYTDKKGVHHRACHKSRKGARGQISAIEAEGVAELDEGLSWVPPTVRLLEGIEDELAALAGEHLTGKPVFEIGDRVMPSKIDPGMRAHSGGSPKGVVVGRGRVGKKYVYDVQWDPLPVLWSGSSWMSDDDATDPEEEAAIIDREVPGGRLRAAR